MKKEQKKKVEEPKKKEEEVLRDPPRWLPMPDTGVCPAGYYPNGGRCVLDVG